MASRLATLFAIAIFRGLGLLPLKTLQRLGAFCGWLAWLTPSTYARRAASNMALAYPDATPAMQKEALQHLLRSVLELPYLWSPRNAGRLHELVTCDHWALIDEALAQGRGLILISPHIGCFEMLGPIYSRRHPATVIFKEPRQVWVRNLINHVRVSPQLSLVPASQKGVKGLVRTLMRGQTIGFLPDQVPTAGDGVCAPFFGKSAYTLTLVQRMQSLRQTPIFTVGLERLADAKGYHLHVVPMASPLSADPVQAATEMNAALEAMIRRMPTQYLWGYNRYKLPRAAAQVKG
jgi:KDO2-lipid IV(A) lauroyltransferase